MTIVRYGRYSRQYDYSDPGIPRGGATGQVITKNSDTDWDFDFENPPIKLEFIKANFLYTNLPLAEQNFGGTGSGGIFLQKVDLTNYTQARLTVFRTNTSAAAGTYVKILYRTTYGTAAGSTICTSELEINTPGIDTEYQTAWLDLVAGAKGVVYIQPRSYGGDGILDPQFGGLYVEFR